MLQEADTGVRSKKKGTLALSKRNMRLRLSSATPTRLPPLVRSTASLLSRSTATSGTPPASGFEGLHMAAVSVFRCYGSRQPALRGRC